MQKPPPPLICSDRARLWSQGDCNKAAWLAGCPTVAAFGGLKAGQVVMLGSVTPPIWLDRPCHVSVRFEGLGEATVTLT